MEPNKAKKLLEALESGKLRTTRLPGELKTLRVTLLDKLGVDYPQSKEDRFELAREKVTAFLIRVPRFSQEIRRQIEMEMDVKVYQLRDSGEQKYYIAINRQAATLAEELESHPRLKAKLERWDTPRSDIF